MRFSPATVYTTGHVFNEQMSKTLAEGFKASRRPACERVVHPSMDGAQYEFVPVEPDAQSLTVVYGILRGTGKILKDCEAQRSDYIYCDHTYFDAKRSQLSAGKLDGHFRLVPNDRYFRSAGDVPSDRWRALNIDLKPWRRTGKHIVLVPVSKFVAEYRGIDPRQWLRETVNQIHRHTDRKIIVKPKDSDQPFDYVLQDAWAVVTLESNAAVQALIAGVPAFTGVSAAAAPLGCQDLSRIEDPPMPDREAHLHALAYQQFSRDEIRNGTARAILEEQFG